MQPVGGWLAKELLARSEDKHDLRFPRAATSATEIGTGGQTEFRRRAMLRAGFTGGFRCRVFFLARPESDWLKVIHWLHRRDRWRGRRRHRRQIAGTT